MCIRDRYTTLLRCDQLPLLRSFNASPRCAYVINNLLFVTCPAIPIHVSPGCVPPRSSELKILTYAVLTAAITLICFSNEGNRYSFDVNMYR